MPYFYKELCLIKWLYCDASNCFDNSFLFDLFADIDECAEGTAGCAQICQNSAGSFHCECRSGYQLDTDKKSCLGKLWDQFTPLVIFSKHRNLPLYYFWATSLTSRLGWRKQTSYVVCTVSMCHNIPIVL